MEDISRDTIGRCREGDMEAFSNVVERYERPVYAYIYRFLGGSRLAASTEDAVQEVFLKVYRKMHTFDPDRGARFSTWLFAVARNHCISLLRKRTVENDRDDAWGGELEAFPDRGLANPRESAGERELGDRVATAVGALPERIRSAFILRHYEGLSYDEIGTVMRCSPGTVKSRVNRAKEKLMQELEGYL